VRARGEEGAGCVKAQNYKAQNYKAQNYKAQN